MLSLIISEPITRVVFISFNPFSDAEVVWVDGGSPGGQGLDCSGVEAALFGSLGLLDCCF